MVISHLFLLVRCNADPFMPKFCLANNCHLNALFCVDRHSKRIKLVSVAQNCTLNVSSDCCICLSPIDHTDKARQSMAKSAQHNM